VLSADGDAACGNARNKSRSFAGHASTQDAKRIESPARHGLIVEHGAPIGETNAE
jgi:hypothetical protein